MTHVIDRDAGTEESNSDLDDIDEQRDLLPNLKRRSDEEILKGQAVKKQKALWDKTLELRILLQKPFADANRLPLGDTRRGMCQSNKEVEGAFANLHETSISTLACFDRILKNSLNQIDRTSVAADISGTHEQEEDQKVLDDLDRLWEELSAAYTRFVPFRDNSVDRWQRKTLLSSGAASTRSKLRAFNQSISQQIEVHMRDFSRLLERMCLRQSSVNVIGMPVTEVEDNISHGFINNSKENFKDFRGDAELLDDSEFYRELLREVLESSDPVSLGLLNSTRNLRHKNRKVVDRRASKGRKIRYNVHEKIVNFMVPTPTIMRPLAEKLFSAGLFQGEGIHVLNL